MTKPSLEKKGISDAFILGGFGYSDTVQLANNYGAQGSNARLNSIDISQASGVSGFLLAASDFTNKISDPKLDALGVQDGFLLKLNPDGQTLWSTSYGGKSATTNINDVTSASPAMVSGNYSGSSLTRPDLPLNGLKDGFLILEDFPYTLSVNKYSDDSTDGGVILSEPSGIQCGATVTLTATPKSGYKFLHWMGDCSGTEACTLSMTSDKFVTAAFQTAPELTVTKTGDGTITSTPAGIACGTSCSAEYTQGISVTLTPVASPGYKFANWTGACSGNEACIVTMDNVKTVGAVFTAIQTYRTLTVSKTGEGTITSIPASVSCGSICSSSFLSGSTVSLIAQPDFGFVFTGWSGACSSTGTCALMMDGDKSVSASFTELPKYQVKITKPSTGVISSEPAGILCGGLNKQCISSFSSAKLTAIPNPGYELIRWNGCQAPEGNTCYVKPAGKMTVSAAFKKLPKYNLKIIKNTLGSIASTLAGLNYPDHKKSCAVKFVKGTEVTLTPVPKAGRAFGGWTGACSGLDPCTFLMDGNKGVGAMFQ